MLELLVAKTGRFLLGLILTTLAIWLGLRLGRRGRTAGETSASLANDPRLYRPFFWGTLALLGLVFGLIWLDGRFFFLWRLQRWWWQGLLVAGRCFLLGVLAVELGLAGGRVGWRTVAHPLGLLLALALTSLEIHHLWPVAPQVGRLHDRRSGMVLQTTGVTCGPATVANLLRLWGRSLEEQEASIGMGIGCDGSSYQEAALYLRQLGFPAARPVVTRLADLLAEDRPALLAVRNFGNWDSHAVALVGAGPAGVVLADPLRGLHSLPAAGLAAIWRGKAVRLGPPAFAASSPPRLSAFVATDLAGPGDRQLATPPVGG